MNRIQRLPESVTNKIAAGEVIERPASVLKELLENAIDAGSTRIDVRIYDGGKEKLQVIDNGTGMSREDAILSIERFSTSKIRQFEDLEKLTSFGFRGEALASIAAVSIIEMSTRTVDDEAGTCLRAEGGKIISVNAVPWNQGTAITVSNLFFNTPARKKFQKNALSETRQLYRIFRYYSLAYPALMFRLYSDDKVIWNLQPSGLLARIADLFDPETLHHLIPVSAADDQFSVTGYISVPEWTRSTRNDQYLFLNKRFIKNRTVEHSIYLGYGTTLNQVAGHPFFVLLLEASPERFDINIHPTKLEVRFQDERGLHHFISQAVRSALGGPRIEKPERDTKAVQLVESVPQFGVIQNIQQTPEHVQSAIEPSQKENSEKILYRGEPRVRPNGQPEHSFGPRSEVPAKHSFDPDKVWQVHNCFIFSQVKSGLIVIDQHTAHERILYEKTLRMLNCGEKPSQQLLFPQTVELNRDESLVLAEIQPHLEKLGFDVRLMGKDIAIIEAVPVDVKIGREGETLKNIIDEYQNDEYKDLDIHDRLARSFACRSAIMRGDKLTPEEMYKLIDDLFATQFPYYCPHGRPTIIDMSLKELNSRFYR